MAASVERSKAMDFASGKSDTQAMPIDEDEFRRAESSEDVTDNEKSAVSSADESGTKSDEDDNVQDKEKTASAVLSDDKPKGNGDLFVHLDTNAAEVVKSDGLRRERKQVERFAHIPVKHEEKSTVILPGSGSKLGDITYVAEQINKRKATDLTNLHRFFYDRRGTTTQIKKNLRLFSGFPFEDKSIEWAKKKKHLEKWGTKIIRDISDVLGVKKGTKEQMIERILDFCLLPADSGMKMAPKKSRSSTSKSKKSPSKSKKSKPAAKSEVGKTKEKGTTRKLASESDDEESTGVNQKLKEPPPSKKSRDGPARKASQNKLYLEEDEESEEKMPSGSESDFNSEEEKKKSPKKSRTPAGRAPAKPKASSSKKIAAKKPPKSKIPKAEDESDSDAPLINSKSKTTVKTPTDEDLKKSVQRIIEKADLKKVSMRMVVDDVFAEYPGVDLQNKKQFIKSLVQEML